MKLKKPAREIVPGDKIYLDTNPSAPKTVTASYQLGARWGIEVQGLAQILQVDADAKLVTWAQ